MDSTISTHIDVDALPSSPTSPSWESPRRSVTQMKGGGPIVIAPIQPTTPTGTLLKQLSLHLKSIVEGSPSIDTLQSFLNRYKIADRKGTRAAGIHPLVQEWFDHRGILEVALKIDRVDIARYLLDEGFNVDGGAIKAMCKNTELVKEVIEQGKWAINQPIGVTLPPILGSFVKNEEMIRWLLAQGADPELACSTGKYTILHCAAQYATIPCLALLLSAAPNSILPGARSADVIFHAATTHSPTNDRIPIIHFLLENGAPIDMVSGCGKYEDQEAHLIDLWVQGRKTALHWAVEHDQVDLVKFLLERGADINRKTWSLATKSEWVSVEQLAEMCGHDAVKEVLANYVVPKEAEG